MNLEDMAWALKASQEDNPNILIHRKNI